MQEARDAVLEEAKKSVTPEILDPGVLAYRAYNEGNYQEAVKQYKRYAKDAPEDPYVLMPLGVSYVAVGDRKNATSTFRKADKLAGDDAYYYVLKGRMLGQQKDAEGPTKRSRKPRSWRATTFTSWAWCTTVTTGWATPTAPRR